MPSNLFVINQGFEKTRQKPDAKTAINFRFRRFSSGRGGKSLARRAAREWEEVASAFRRGKR
jgi:hypothetical protein